MSNKSLCVSALLLASIMLFSALPLSAAATPHGGGAIQQVPFAAMIEDGANRIRIDNDSDLQNQAAMHLWPGTGSSSDPFLVQGWTLQGDDSAPAILVGNTSLHLRFIDILVQDLRENSYPPLMVFNNVTGVDLDRVHAYQEFENDSLEVQDSRDVGVLNCTLGNVYVNECDDVTLGNCTVGPCDGLYVMQSRNLTISDCLFDSTCVFDMYHCNGVMLSNNTLLNITTGVGLIYSDHVTLWSNTFLNCSLCVNPESLNGGHDPYRHLVAPDNNTVNGSPLVFLRDIQLLGEVPAGAGQLILYNVTGATVTDYDLQRCTNPLSAMNCSDLRLSAVQLEWAYLGMIFSGCRDLVVSTCDLDHCLYGMMALSSASVLFRGNTLNGSYYADLSTMPGAGECGICMRNCDGQAMGNGISSYYTALVLGETPGAQVLNNTIVHAEYGVRLISSDGVQVSGNRLTGAGYGVYAENSREANIKDSMIVQGRYGCFLSNSDRCYLLNNSISGCERYGICLFTGSDLNQIAGNALQGNNGAGPQFSPSARQAYDKGAGNRWNGSSGGNTWGDWQGPDTDRDGFVDSPYPIDGASNARDLLPLVSQSVADDRTPPSLAITSPAEGTWSGEHSLMVTWISADNETSVVTHWLSLDGSDWWEVGMAGSSEMSETDGWHTLSVKAVDLAGNFAVKNVTFGFDRTAPTVEVGPFPAWYSSSNVSIAWNATDAGIGLMKVEMQLDGGEWVNVTGGGPSLLTGVGEGYHFVAVRATDLLGWNSSIGEWFEVFMGTRRLSITTPAEGELFADEVFVAWEIEGLSLPYQVWMSVDGQIPFYVAGDNNILAGLADGRHSILVWAEDDHGHTASDAVNVTVDRLAPRIDITAPAAGSFLPQGVTLLAWTVSDSSAVGVKWKLDEGAWNDAQGSSASVSGMCEGRHTLQVSATDAAGHSAVDSVIFTVDSVAPLAAITSPGQGVLLNESHIDIIWTVSDATEVTAEWSLDGGPWTQVDGDRVALALEDGQHTFLLSCQDRSGLFGNASVSFSVDTAVPSVFIHCPEDGAMLNTSVAEVHWTVNDRSDTRCLWRLDGGDWSEASGNVTGLVGLNDGAHYFELRCADAANNSAAASISFIVDTHPPSAAVSVNGDVRSTHWSVTIMPSEELAVCGLTMNGEAIEARMANGSLVLVMEAPLLGDEVRLVINCTDMAGNRATLSWNRSFDPPSYWVSGAVIDEQEQPVCGASVLLDGRQAAFTDDRGRFNVTCSRGPHELILAKDGYQNLTRSLTVGEGTALQGLTMMPLEYDENGWNPIPLVLAGALTIAAVGAISFIVARKKR